MTYPLPKVEGQPTIEEVKSYLEYAIHGFDKDPADNAFQAGILSACESIYDDLFLTAAERVAKYVNR